ncbi:MAG: hypothetical protein V3V99_08685 [candidate division Zixibacteria bacterium]
MRSIWRGRNVVNSIGRNYLLICFCISLTISNVSWGQCIADKNSGINKNHKNVNVIECFVPKVMPRQNLGLTTVTKSENSSNQSMGRWRTYVVQCRDILKITTISGRKIKGRYVALSSESLSICRREHYMEVTRSEIKRLQIGKRDLLKNGLASLGVAIGSMLLLDLANVNYSENAIWLGGFGIGVFVGITSLWYEDVDLDNSFFAQDCRSTCPKD